MELLKSITVLLEALLNVGSEAVQILVPLVPLLLWIAFWMFAVNWVKLYEIIFFRGAWIGILLIMVMTIIGWGCIAPPESGSHVIAGLSVSNFVGKTVYVVGLTAIAGVCASVQLAGLCGPLCNFDEVAPEAVEHAH